MHGGKTILNNPTNSHQVFTISFWHLVIAPPPQWVFKVRTDYDYDIIHYDDCQPVTGTVMSPARPRPESVEPECFASWNISWDALSGGVSHQQGSIMTRVLGSKYHWCVICTLADQFRDLVLTWKWGGLLFGLLARP